MIQLKGKKKEKEKTHPSGPIETNIKLISAQILLHHVKKQTNANDVFGN